MAYPPGSIQYVDGKELKEMNKRTEFIAPNPKVRQDFEDNIRVLVSILNANNVSGETVQMVNEKIRQITSIYYNPVLIIKEI